MLWTRFSLQSGTVGATPGSVGGTVPRQKAFLASEVLAAHEAREIGTARWANPELREALDGISTSAKAPTSQNLANLLKSRRDRTFGYWVLKGVAGGKRGMVYRAVYVGPELPKQEGNVEPLKTMADSAGNCEVDFSAHWPQSRSTSQEATPGGDAGGAGTLGF